MLFIETGWTTISKMTISKTTKTTIFIGLVIMSGCFIMKAGSSDCICTNRKAGKYCGWRGCGVSNTHIYQCNGTYGSPAFDYGPCKLSCISTGGSNDNCTTETTAQPVNDSTAPPVTECSALPENECSALSSSEGSTEQMTERYTNLLSEAATELSTARTSEAVTESAKESSTERFPEPISEDSTEFFFTFESQEYEASSKEGSSEPFHEASTKASKKSDCICINVLAGKYCGWRGCNATHIYQCNGRNGSDALDYGWCKLGCVSTGGSSDHCRNTSTSTSGTVSPQSLSDDSAQLVTAQAPEAEKDKKEKKDKKDKKEKDNPKN